MKKLLLLGLVVAFGLSVNAQNLRQELQQHKALDKMEVAFGPEKPSTIIQNLYKPNYDGKNKFVSIIDIGTSANAYSNGYAGGQKNILAYNAEINTVTHIHRMGGALDPGGYSGDLGYDISTDGGQNFTNMVECHVAVDNAGGTYYTDAARYPHHGIYNPEGNTDPANAHVMFYAPTLDGTNSADSWGGSVFGASNIGDPSTPTRHLLHSSPGDGIYRYIPDAFTLTNTGDFWVVDVNQDWSSGSLVYMGNLIVTHGRWNDDLNDFELVEEFLLESPVAVHPDIVRPAFAKVEFSPDGQTGYIAIISDNDELEFSAGTYFPIIWKTTNGGETWDDPIEVELGGPDGIEAIHNYITDEDWEALWEPPAPLRDEVWFTTAFDFDMTVDINGNPHLAVGVGVTTTEYSIISGHPYYAIADIWSPDGGITWDAYIIDKPIQFRSDINENYGEDSRTQIARTHAGDYVFVGYLDTNIEDETGNNYPDIYARAICVDGPSEGWMSVDNDGEEAATNVTFLSDGMEQAYFFAMSNEVIPTGEPDEFIIPFAYQQMNPADPGEACQYKYIQDFMFDLPVGINEIQTENTFNVAQNYPNPFSGQTDINVTLNAASNLSLDVYNLMGQNVYSVNAGEVSGNYTFTLNVDLQPGVYFYSVTAGSSTISKKMIVE